MKRYTSYNVDTGAILFSFDGRDEDIALNQPCIEGEYSANLFRIVGGLPVAKDAAEIEQAEIAFAWVAFRNRRNQLLSACDWTQTADAPVDRAAWAAYRQALRDLPANTDDPRNPQWPSPPA